MVSRRLISGVVLADGYHVGIVNDFDGVFQTPGIGGQAPGGQGSV
jgi:hypothetical protein